MSGIDPRFITATDLECLILDKDTAASLANGYVNFWQDADRTVPKLVYQLVNAGGSPPNYTYQPLPNPVILSSIGTFMDNAGNNVALYYFPWTSFNSDAVVELYYVEVFNSLGVQQFVREGWPNYFGTFDEEVLPVLQGNLTNLLTNPQFTSILFGPTMPLTITAAGSGTSVTNIAPGWTLTIVSSGASSVTVTQTPVAGVSQFPTNPPYTLDFTASTNITSMILSQTLSHSPDVWSPSTSGTNGYVATNIVVSNNTSLSVQYAPSQATAGNPQTILSVNNTSGAYAEFTNTIQLLPAANTDTGATGSVAINIVLPVLGNSSITSIQVVGLNANLKNIEYQQVPVTREVDHMFNYWFPFLAQKRIPSWLVGWDFALNPTQALGPSGGPTAGANTSYYIWDQTILFQSAASNLNFARGTDGSLQLSAVGNTQFALVQYLQAEAVDLLSGPLSVNIAAYASAAATGTISLWYTTGSSLPAINSGNSIVATLAVGGKPATFNGTWVEVPRSGLGDATFTIPTSTSTVDIPYAGWNLTTGAATAKFFAIVVGFAQVVDTQVINFNSISMVPGLIATRPAPLSKSQTLQALQTYYEMSFQQGTVPANAIGFLTGEYYTAQTLAASTANEQLGTFSFKVTKIASPTVTIYNPVNANSQAYDQSIGADCSLTSSHAFQNSFFGTCTTAAGSSLGDHISIHFTADARLGVV